MAANWVPIWPRKRKRAVLTLNAPPELLVRRFADDFRRLKGAGPDGRIGVAVSGGPDSLALLLLATAAFPGQVEAATVDHGLREAAPDEARFVGDLCAARGIPHAILTLDALDAGNVSARAREARYAALNDWCGDRKLDWLLTAHHADDQLETVIMRLNRGAGVAGLSGVRARQGRIVRALLSWRQRELVALVVEAGIVAVDDPSNSDDRYDRARLRKSLAGSDWIDPLAVVESAAALADADAAIAWSVDALEAALVRVAGHQITVDYNADLPAEYVRRLVLRCLRRIDPDCAPRGAALSRLISTLESGGSATLGNILARGGKIWIFERAPPRRQLDSQ
jgi:tRNA(Ile)-lysidine synthase